MSEGDVVVRRIAVNVERDPASLAPLLGALCERKPTGSASLIAPFGFSFKAEPQMFYFVAIGASFGMGIMLTEFGLYLRRISYVATSLSVVFFALGALSLAVFVRGLVTRTEVVAVGQRLEYRVRVGKRVVRREGVDAHDVVAVLVVRDGAATRVVLAGPRHRSVAVLYRAKWLDPESFAPWFAEMVALVARAASAEP